MEYSDDDDDEDSDSEESDSEDDNGIDKEDNLNKGNNNNKIDTSNNNNSSSSRNSAHHIKNTTNRILICPRVGEDGINWVDPEFRGSAILQARNKADSIRKEKDRPGLVCEHDDELEEGLEVPDHPGLVFGGGSKSELEEMFNPARYDFTPLPDLGENPLVTPDNVPDGFEVGPMPTFEDLKGRAPQSPIAGFEFVPIPGTEGNMPGDGNLLNESLLGRPKRQKKQ